jgi:hypothetical protein
MKTKKTTTIEVPVKYAKGDKVWIIEEDAECQGDKCYACGLLDFRDAYSVAEAKVIDFAFTMDEESHIVCAGYRLSWRKRKEYLPSQYIYNTESAATKALAKLLEEAR